MEGFVGIVLAGGQSRRFGSPKAFAKTGGKYFYQYAMAALEPVAEQTVVVTNPSLYEMFASRGVKCVNDLSEFRQKGPLAGLYTGMQYVKSDWYIVVPTDLPCLTSSILCMLKAYAVSTCEAVVPIINGKPEPLVGLYHAGTMPIINKRLREEKLSMKGLLEALHVCYVDMLALTAFWNINYKHELDKLEGKT